LPFQQIPLFLTGKQLKKVLEILCGALAGLALFAIMLLTFFDVSGRKFLSHSITGSLELTELLMVVVILPRFLWSLSKASTWCSTPWMDFCQVGFAHFNKP